jgi:photosynthetic reaction center cytochrome c subunit
MARRSRNTLLMWAAVAALTLTLPATLAQFGPTSSQPPQASAEPTISEQKISKQKISEQKTAEPKTAEQAFKNIGVLKEVPADQLIPAMQFINAALGVECDFCHVQGAFDKDDKKPKATARKMMQMMFAINKDNFEGHREVTCYSCHRGAAKPQTIPAIVAEEHGPSEAENAERTTPPALPTADQVIDKYIQALGGAAAIETISTRVEQGSADFGGHEVPVEVFAKAPDQRATAMHLPKGDSVTASNGNEGWLAAPGRPVRDMSSSELAAAKLDADLHFATDIKRIFNGLKVERADKIAGRDVYVVVANWEGRPPVELYFEQQSGLLARMVRYSDSPLGLNPTQIDYADYRRQNGVSFPFRWTIARPGGSFTIQVQQAQQNVVIDDARFVKPAEAAAPKAAQ